METTEANEEFAEASRSTAIDSRNGILTEVLGQLLGRGKQPKSKLACFPKETKYTREDSKNTLKTLGKSPKHKSHPPDSPTLDEKAAQLTELLNELVPPRLMKRVVKLLKEQKRDREPTKQ